MEFKKKRESAFWEKVFLFIFGSSVIISFIFSETRNLGFSEVLAFLSMILVYLVFAHQKWKASDKFLKVVAFGTYFSVFLAFVMYFTKDEPRMMGPFFNLLYHSNVWPNAFGLFLIMVWPVFLFLGRKKWTWLESMELGILFTALGLTFSRGAMIAVCGQIVLVLIYLGLTRKIKLSGLAHIALVVAIAAVLFNATNYLRGLGHTVINLEERVNFENNEVLTSKQERVDFWKGAIDLTEDKPLFGYGPFSFRQAYNPIQKTFLGNSDHPHNVFLKIGSENGVIALAGFVGFLMTVLITAISRFKRFSQKRKDLIFLTGVSIVGAFAHSLIDYNFNFLVNILLLFMLLAVFRSTAVITVKTKKIKNYLFLPIIILALVSAYEFGVLFLSQTYNYDFQKYSIFPRNYFLDKGKIELSENDFDGASEYLDKHLELNSLDSEAYYLKGWIYCSNENPDKDLEICTENFNTALELNSQNEIKYYRDYFRALELEGANLNNEELADLLDESLELLKMYLVYVEQNVHFTAYTENVENAADFIDILKKYMTLEEQEKWEKMKQNMLGKADQIRGLKEY